MSMSSVLWFRRDLRLHDHPALHAAASDGPVLALFVLDDALLRPAGAPRISFLYQTLRALDASLRERGGTLVVRRGDPVDVVPAIAAEIGASAVHVSADFGPYGARRDREVAARIQLIATGSPYAVSPGRVVKQDGDPFKVFTPFYRAWVAHGWRAPAGAPPNIEWINATGETIPPVSLDLPPAGEDAALTAWKAYCARDLAEYAAVRDRPDAIDTGRLSGLVEFNDVSFSYDGKRPAIEDLSFTALPGQTIALVGPTGAGKSTAIALLHRAFDPQSGIIKIDGMDIRGLKLTALRRNIGVVFQEALLFNRSIADNLRVGKPDATDEEMRAAAARAQALDFIERGEKKFETHAGERGRMLSGGERQRLSIARALLKDPPILILDEATSALDAVTEARVNAALDEVMRGRTTFVIAHRLSTIRNATRILMFDNGRVIESGTFDELVAKGGRFAELAKAQFMVQQNAHAGIEAK